MTLDELRAECDSADRTGAPDITLLIPRRTSMRGLPRGELLCDNAERGRVYRFKVTALRRLIARAQPK